MLIVHTIKVIFRVTRVVSDFPSGQCTTLTKRVQVVLSCLSGVLTYCYHDVIWSCLTSLVRHFLAKID